MRALEATQTTDRPRRFSLCPEHKAVEEYEKTRAFGGDMITTRHPLYPPALAAIADPPPILSVFGDAAMLSNQMIGIIGSRNASAVGIRMAETLAQELGENGFTIVSGLARGIDGAAHKSSISTGTVAVLAGGINQVYPSEHQGLYRAIAEHGCVVSEVPFGRIAKARDFPKRIALSPACPAGWWSSRPRIGRAL